MPINIHEFLLNSITINKTNIIIKNTYNVFSRLIYFAIEIWFINQTVEHTGKIEICQISCLGILAVVINKPLTCLYIKYLLSISSNVKGVNKRLKKTFVWMNLFF